MAYPLPAQLQNFSLSGSGCSIGDTTLTLSSFQTIDGVDLVIGDFGGSGYMTIEPGSRDREEQISFTGITQNANGTATLTGIKTVLFTTPYTETSAFAKSHPGGVVAVVTNTSGFYNAIKTYIDTALSAGAVPATTTVNGIGHVSVAPSDAANPIFVGTNDPRMPTQGENDALASTTTPASSNLYITQKDFQKGLENYAADAGSTDAYAITLAPAITGYTPGMVFRFRANTINTGAATLNVNALGAKSIVKNYNVALATGDIKALQMVEVQYDNGTDTFQLLSPVSNVLSTVSSGAVDYNLATASGVQNIAHSLGVIPRLIKIQALYTDNASGAASAFLSIANTVYTSSESSRYVAYLTGDGATSSNSTSGSLFRVHAGGSGLTRYQTGVITVDATNIIITWTKTDSPTGSAMLVWEAFA